MSKKHKKSTNSKRKIASACYMPEESKIPRAEAVNSNLFIEFKACQMDAGGPYGWSNFDSSCLKELMQKIFETQKLTWQVIAENGSHPISINKLVHHAQKRLTTIKKDDLDDLYSLRISGKKRIWGIRERNIFWILWWDPNHESMSKSKETYLKCNGAMIVL